MKVNMNTSVKKFADLEVGGDEKRLHIYLQKPTKCAELLNGVKFVLCLELVILVGWLGFMAVDSYVERFQYRSRMENYEFTDSPIGIDNTSDLETTTIAITESSLLNTDEITEKLITESLVAQENVNKDQKIPESLDESVTPWIIPDVQNYDYSERDDYLNSFPNINTPTEDNEKEMSPSETKCADDELFSALQPDGLYGSESRCISMNLWIQYLRARTLSEMPWYPTALEESEFSTLPPSELTDYL